MQQSALMSRNVVCRSGELGTIADFLAAARARPSGLTIEGDAGIGKTTLWSFATEQAREYGSCVLSASVGKAESAMNYTAVADLLSEVESSAFLRLPNAQRLAVDTVLLNGDDDGLKPDQRTVAAAFLAVVETLAADAPVLLAIDDLQWLDASSRAVLNFAARRIKGRVGVLVTERPQAGCPTAMSWLRVGAKNDIGRILLGPLSTGGLHTLISGRLGRSLPRPTMLRIAEISQGNPFYALELARAAGAESPAVEQELPRALADLVRVQIGDLDDEVRDVLLAAACATSPTVDLLAQANGITAAETVALLETAESKGIIAIQGNRVRFTHPLLAKGVYAGARPSWRRRMHSALSRAEVLPEVKARHLALATTSHDPTTLETLDAAAEAARARGAPAAAAELLELAIRLGGDTPRRRIRSSRNHFHAGNFGYARALLEPCAQELPPGPMRASAVALLAEMRMYHDSFAQAVELLTRALEDGKGDRALLAQILVLLSFARMNTGDEDSSLRNASQALTLTDELELPALSSHACAMWVMVNFMCGHDVDAARLRRALELEVSDAEIPTPFGASTVSALVLAWTGRLDEARRQLSSVRNRCIDRAEYGHLMFLDLHNTMVEVWRGNFAEAAQIANDAMERAQQFGGDHAFVIADVSAAVLAVYAGDEQKARTHGRAAIERASRCGSPRMADQAVTSLALLEVSLGNYADALNTIEPLVARFNPDAGTEIATAAFLPDAVEAMIALGRLDDAKPIIDALEHHGQRLHRPWMLAVGARCRSMLLAAQGHLDQATRTAEQAMAAHQALPMPFERARTQLLLGQLQRRQRQKESATTTLTEALASFEGMNAALWVDRTRSELARISVNPTRALLLTPSEQRVAELAASGMTNRDIGAAVFISPKTVDAHLARIYRKLGIHSRAELGRVICQQTERKPHLPPGGAQQLTSGHSSGQVAG